MERRHFLIAIQRHIGGADIEDEFGRRLGMGGDELFDQYPVQGDTSARVARVSSREKVGG